ncbi:hypothetical protein DFJ74DRAFT_706887 [Hyaloraphidium curvatum]|nr:hypothetical protein DFJ74DRAFT_706887 [Hyaloraphidium curvatum]
MLLTSVLAESSKALSAYLAGSRGKTAGNVAMDVLRLFHNTWFSNGKGPERRPTADDPFLDLACSSICIVQMVRPDLLRSHPAQVDFQSTAKKIREASRSLQWPAASAEARDRCDHCDAEGKLKRCARCGVARYCGAECQRAAWGEHKALCTAQRQTEQMRDEPCGCCTGGHVHAADVAKRGKRR